MADQRFSDPLPGSLVPNLWSWASTTCRPFTTHASSARTEKDKNAHASALIVTTKQTTIASKKACTDCLVSITTSHAPLPRLPIASDVRIHRAQVVPSPEIAQLL